MVSIAPVAELVDAPDSKSGSFWEWEFESPRGHHSQTNSPIKSLRETRNMAGSVNKVILIGNLGNDPDIRSMQTGSRVANLSIATSESWKDRNTGERKERTEWHRVVVFNEGLVSICENYLRKGAKVYIEGQLETRKWTDQNGQDKYTTEVVLRPFRGELTMLDSRGGSEGGYQQQSRPMAAAASGGGSAAAAPVHDDFEDDIPF